MRIVTSSTSRARPVVDDDAAAGHVDLGHERADEREEHLARPAYGSRAGPGRRCARLGQLAHDLAVGGLDAQPDELVVVELLGVLRALVRVDRAR